MNGESDEDRRRGPRAFDVPADERVEAVSEPVPTTGGTSSTSPSLSDDARRRPRALEPIGISFEDDRLADGDQNGPAVALPPPRRNPWPALVVSAALGLLGLAVGLWIEGLVSRLFELAPWAGLVGLALTAVLVGALLALAVRELLALRRLASLTAVRERAARALASNDEALAVEIATELAQLFSERPETARGRKELAAISRDVMDAADRLAVVERALLDPLDRAAEAVVLASARRVSIVTAVAPRALIDIAFVLLENARLVRRVATLYGLRPGRLGFLRLLKNVLGHLAVTGTIAVGDSVLGEAVGHGVASRISSRFGEGIVNGLLTARVGIAAMDLCRPLPFAARSRPTIGSLTSRLVRSLTARG